MGAAGRVPRLRVPPKFADYVYWGGIALAIICLSANLIVCAIRSGMLLLDMHVATIAILFFGIGVSTICVVLWVGHVTNIRLIQGKIAWLIWSVLICSILGTVAAAFKAAWNAPQHVTIEKFVLLDESQVAEDGDHHLAFKSLVPRANYDYAVTKLPDGSKDAWIAFGFIVSGFGKSISGNFNVNGTVALSSSSRDLIDEGELPVATDDDYLNNRSMIKQFIQKNGSKELEQVFGPMKGKVLYLQALRRFQPEVLDSGSKKLRILIRDSIKNTYGEYTQDLVFR